MLSIRKIFSMGCIAWIAVGCGGGNNGGNNSSSAPTRPVERALYLDTENGVAAFAIDTATGKLTSISGSPFSPPGGTIRTGIVIHPSGKLIYEFSLTPSDSSANSSAILGGYSIDKDTGALVRVTTYDIGNAKGGWSGFQFGQGGSFVYAWSVSRGQKICGLDSETGEVETCAFLSFGGTYSTINPKSAFSYSATNGTLFQYNLDLSNRDALGLIASTLVDSIPLGYTPSGLLFFSPNYKYAYFISLNSLNGTLLSFKIDPVTTLLSMGGASKTSLANMGAVRARVITPDENYMYLCDDSYIYTYRIDPTTGNVSLTGAPAAFGGTGVRDSKVSPNGKFLLLTTQTASIAVFNINQTTGELTPATGSPFGAASSSPGTIAIDPSGQFFYVTDSINGTITHYSLDPSTGATSAMGSYPTGVHPITPVIVNLR